MPPKQVCPQVDVLVMDGAALVQMLNPGKCQTFADYASTTFVPNIKSNLSTVQRLDLVWDQYFCGSLKAATRTKRGSGIRRRVSSTSLIPKMWANFLHVDENKIELFAFLSSQIVDDLHVESNKQLFVTSGCHTLSRPVQQVFSELDPCSHEEADTRMMLHVFHAVNSGYNKIMIRTVDTDVVVLAINFQQRHPVMELWVAFGTGKNLRYIAVHELVSSLGPERAQGILFFHAFTGCDTVSSFGGHGKKSAWDTWNSFPNVTDAFIKLSSEPHAVSENSEYLPTLERFVVLLYDRTSNKLHVNDSRKQLFTKKCRGMDSLPPTQAALIQHIKRAVLQSGYCWYRSLQAQQNLPSPKDWGWERSSDEDDWQPFWSTLPDVGKCCPELVKCGCKKGCNKRCKCVKAGLKCTALCFCDGICDRD